ncbi:MAG: DUF1320 domain-containing protein [Pseudomonadota bacterium]
MTAYCTQTDLQNIYGEPSLIRLTDRGEVATGTVNVAAVTAAIAKAGNEIDGYLAARYAMPLTTVPPLVKELAEDMSFYYLHAFNVDDLVKDKYEAAIARLKDIAKGTIRLPIAEGEIETTGESGAVATDRDRPMTADSLKGFI